MKLLDQRVMELEEDLRQINTEYNQAVSRAKSMQQKVEELNRVRNETELERNEAVFLKDIRDGVLSVHNVMTGKKVEIAYFA